MLKPDFAREPKPLRYGGGGLLSKLHFGLGVFLVEYLAAACRLAVFDVVRSVQHRAIGAEFVGRTHFRHAVRVAEDFFNSGDGLVGDGHGTDAVETAGAEVVVADLALLLVPLDKTFTTVVAVIDGMDNAHRRAIEGAFPAGHVDGRLIGFGILEFAAPGLAQKWTEGFEM